MPIAIGVSVGVVLLGVIAVAYRRVRARRQQRQTAWDDDFGGMSQQRDSTYGMYNNSDPFKSTLDQYHRSPDQPMYEDYQTPQTPQTQYQQPYQQPYQQSYQQQPYQHTY